MSPTHRRPVKPNLATFIIVCLHRTCLKEAARPRAWHTLWYNYCVGIRWLMGSAGGSWFWLSRNSFEKLESELRSFYDTHRLSSYMCLCFICSEVSQEFLQLAFQLRDLTLPQLKTLWQEASFKCRNDWSVFPQSFMMEGLSASPSGLHQCLHMTV